MGFGDQTDSPGFDIELVADGARQTFVTGMRARGTAPPDEPRGIEYFDNREFAQTWAMRHLAC
jgi:hypothetical protein